MERGLDLVSSPFRFGLVSSRLPTCRLSDGVNGVENIRDCQGSTLGPSPQIWGSTLSKSPSWWLKDAMDVAKARMANTKAILRTQPANTTPQHRFATVAKEHHAMQI